MLYEVITITPVRGMEGIREAAIEVKNPLPEWQFLDGVTLRCAVAHGLVNARKLMELPAERFNQYHFIEIMACPGGCLGGGGQPIPTSPEIRNRRMEAIYAEVV